MADSTDDALFGYDFNVFPEDAICGILLKSAIDKGNLKNVKARLRKGVDVNASYRCLRGSSFLHVAVDNYQFEIAKILINYGADVNMTRQDSILPPIYSAVKNLDMRMIKLLLFSGAVVENISDLLCSAFQYLGLEIVEFLLQHDTKFDTNAGSLNGETALDNLIAGPIFMYKCHIDNFRHKREETDRRKAEMAGSFFHEEATVDARTIHGETLLYAAVDRSLPKLIDTLIKCGAEIDEKNYSYGRMTPLMSAVKQDDFNKVQSLINRLPDSEIRDVNGETALHHAVRRTSKKIIEALLNYGADINATSKDGRTPYTTSMKTYSSMLSLEMHIHRMMALDLYVNTKNLQRFNLSEYFFDKCKREVEKMKRTKMSSSNFSFDSVLTKGTKTLAAYVKNEEIAKALSVRDDYAEIFPIYSGMIYYRFVKFAKLEPLLVMSEQPLGSLIGFGLPYSVSIELLSYLSITDLKNLMKASPDATDSLTICQ